MKSRAIYKFILLILILQTILLIFFNRSLLLKNYDVNYWKDRFEHSQWQMPMSERIIGDDGLYSYVGLSLVNGLSPSQFNPETPPLGKYLIGLSIKLFNNPVYYSIFIGIITIYLYFLLSKIVLKNDLFAIFATLILFTDPLFFSQFWKSWLDMLQLMFLLLSILSIYKSGKQKNSYYLILSGLSLGFFAQSKFPILFPVIFIFELFWVYKNKLINKYLFYLAGLILGILLPYLRFFILGNSVIDFIKLEKYVLSFYLKSQLKVHFGSFLESVFIGYFPQINSSGLVKVNEWTLFWPISIVLSVLTTIKLYKKDIFVKYIGILIVISLFIFSLIPSFPRYFLMIFPFSSLLMVVFIKEFFKVKAQKIIIIIFVIFSFINSLVFLIPLPQTVLSDYYYNFSHQYFQDIYQEDVVGAGNNFSRQAFFNLSKQTMLDSQIDSIEIKEISRSIPYLGNKGTVKILVTYKTRNLGNFSEEKTLKLEQVNSEWKIIWDWSLLLDGFNPNLKSKTIVDLGKRGSIYKYNTVLAEDTNGYLISVSPSLIQPDKEQEMLGLLSSISGIAKVRLQNTYNENVIPNTYIALFSNDIQLSDSLLGEIKAFKGVFLSEYPTRIYFDSKLLSPASVENVNYYECCSRIYSSFNYHGITGMEKKYDSDLSGNSGGKIELIDKNGQIIKILLDRQLRNGKDVYL